MKRWKMIVVQIVICFAMFQFAWYGLKDNPLFTLLFWVASIAYALANYWEGQNQARGLYDNTHKGRRQ